MKVRIYIGLLLMMTSFLTACKKQEEEIVNSKAQSGYYYDVKEEWTEEEYKEQHGMELQDFAAPVMSPYLYTFEVENPNNPIEDIALELGKIMLEDFSKKYEGKTFTITEYQNLVVNVMDLTEFQQWEERFGQTVHLKDTQWLCTFTCEYKYTGTYADIGEMPVDMEWKEGLDMDGSGENYVFIIQKLEENEYGMRAMPKTYYEIVQ